MSTKELRVSTMMGLTIPKFARSKQTSQLIDDRIADSVMFSPIIPSIPSPAIPHAPTTPLLIPNIGIAKSNNAPTPSTILAPDEDPWLPQRTEGSSEVKIAAITPIGTIAMVPTTDKRPPTPRRLPFTPGRHLTLKVVNDPDPNDPILTATIYLDCTKDQDYDHVAARMRSITENTLTLQRQYKNNLKPLINVVGKVSSEVFEEALLIYENNQVYYQDRIDNNDLDIKTIQDRLTELEYWFLCIIEPRSNDNITDWIERERTKLIKGISAYCDPELYPYITPAPAHIRDLITQNQQGLF